MSDFYEKVNAAWPQQIPVCTRTEAERAANKLMKKWCGFGVGYIPKVWVSSERTRSYKGWHRLVHDVSHRANRILYPNPTGHKHHNGQHAEIELEMIQHVIAQGWLEGKLRPKARIKPTIDRTARLRERLARWESKRKRAETAIKKLTRSLRYHERKTSVQTD